MLFMVIETFANNDMIPAYQKIKDEGRVLPEGLTYHGSWIAADFSRCFQVMECDDIALIQDWVLYWRDAGVTFDIVPVSASQNVQALVAPHLSG